MNGVLRLIVSEGVVVLPWACLEGVAGQLSGERPERIWQSRSCCCFFAAFAVAQIRAKSYFEDVDFHTLTTLFDEPGSHCQ